MVRLLFPVFFLLSFSLTAQVPLKDTSPVITSTGVALLLPTADPSPVTMNKTIAVDSGTLIKIKLLNDVSSKSFQEGDTMNFSIAEDILVGKMVIIKAGALLMGTIEKASKAKSIGKAGELVFSLRYVRAVDGTKIYLKPLMANIEGKDRVGSTVAGSIVLGPLFLFRKGKDVNISKGEIIETFTDRIYAVQVPW